MTKQEEFSNQNSCFNRARQEELMFILLERDIATPDTIRYWAQLRVKSGKNTLKSAQIQEALTLADRIEQRKRVDSKVYGMAKLAYDAFNQKMFGLGEKTRQFCDVDDYTRDAWKAAARVILNNHLEASE